MTSRDAEAVVGVAARIGAVEREVRTAERDGEPCRIVVASQRYDTDIDDLWDALTSAERIPRWFLPITGDLELGGRYQLQGNAGGVVEQCDPPHRVALTWEMGGEVSWVVLRLTAESGDRTLLELEHTAAVPEEMWQSYGPGAVGVGWDLALMGLGLHVSTGAPVNSDNIEAWSASDEGRQFITASSDGWVAANVAAGADEATARAGGQQTLQFYLPPTTPGES